MRNAECFSMLQLASWGMYFEESITNTQSYSEGASKMVQWKESRNIVQIRRDGGMTAEVQLTLVRNLEGTGRSVATALWSRAPIDKVIKAFLPQFLLVDEGCTS